MDLTANPRSTSTRWVLKNNWLLLIGALLHGVIIVANTIYDPTEAVLATTIRLSTPLILGALCGLIGERTGVVNIGIEGQMLLAAFFALEWAGRERAFALAELGQRWRPWVRWGFYYAVVLCILQFSGPDQQFIYFQF